MTFSQECSPKLIIMVENRLCNRWLLRVLKPLLSNVFPEKHTGCHGWATCFETEKLLCCCRWRIVVDDLHLELCHGWHWFLTSNKIWNCQTYKFFSSWSVRHALIFWVVLFSFLSVCCILLMAWTFFMEHVSLVSLSMVLNLRFIQIYTHCYDDFFFSVSLWRKIISDIHPN